VKQEEALELLSGDDDEEQMLLVRELLQFSPSFEFHHLSGSIGRREGSEAQAGRGRLVSEEGQAGRFADGIWRRSD
jgi:hypothetical protein